MTLLLGTPAVAVLLQLGADQKYMLGGAVLCFLGLLATLRTTFSAPVNRSSLVRLQNYLDRDENLSPLERLVAHNEAQEASKKRRREKSSDLLPTLSKWLQNSRVEFLNKMSADLNRIGSSWRASEVVYVSVLAAMLLFLVVGIVMRRVTLGLILAGVGFMVPIKAVGFAARRWMAKFETQLADTLLLMSNATAAGYGFQQAMEMVAREGQPPMAEEFMRMSQEVQIGVPIADALSHMSERVQNADFSLAVTAIQISMEVGGALSEILRSISETIRDRVRIRGEIRILTTQGKMTGWGLSALPVFMFLLLGVVGSDEHEKYTDPLLNGQVYPAGPKLVITGFVLQALGYFIINRIVNIEI